MLDISAKSSIAKWLEAMPKGGAWHVISDYVFGDPDRHDTASYVLLLCRDKLDTILGYINNQAPTDIKLSRAASPELICYLQSPVVFSFTFVLDDGDSFLSTYASVTEIIRGLEDLQLFVASLEANSPGLNPYFSEVQK